MLVALHRVRGIIGMARVWRLTAKWGVAFNVNTIDDIMLSFTIKIVCISARGCELPAAPNFLSLCIDKHSNRLVFMGISHINDEFIEDMGWPYQQYELTVNPCYLEEVSVAELSLSLEDYECIYDSKANTLYILFRDKIIGAVTPTGLVGWGCRYEFGLGVRRGE